MDSAQASDLAYQLVVKFTGYTDEAVDDLCGELERLTNYDAAQAAVRSVIETHQKSFRPAWGQIFTAYAAAVPRFPTTNPKALANPNGYGPVTPERSAVFRNAVRLMTDPDFQPRPKCVRPCPEGCPMHSPTALRTRWREAVEASEQGHTSSRAFTVAHKLDS